MNDLSSQGVKVELIAARTGFHVASLSSGLPVCGVGERTERPLPRLPDCQ